MTDATYFLPYDVTPAALRLRGRRKPPVAVGQLVTLSALVVAATAVGVGPATAPGSVKLPLVAARAIAVSAEVAQRAAQALAAVPSPWLEADFAAGVPATFTDSHPVAATFRWTGAPALLASTEPAAPTVGTAQANATEAAAPGPAQLALASDTDDAIPMPPVAAAASPLLAAEVPLPTPRPADLVPRDMAPTLDRTPIRAPHRPMAVAMAAPATTAAPADNRSFLEKFFDVTPSTTAPALGYAAAEDGFFSRLRGASGNPARSYGAGTAVYEIASHTVFMPDGSKLEAHSGLGAHLDDPRFVHERMRGPTPPATYALTLRESLFHGVQALRLTPVGSSVFGRVGLLAHTYMLGPNGDSNGCVSFRNYKSFLQAFQSGDVRRLVVVARLS